GAAAVLARADRGALRAQAVVFVAGADEHGAGARQRRAAPFERHPVVGAAVLEQQLRAALHGRAAVVVGQLHAAVERLAVVGGGGGQGGGQHRGAQQGGDVVHAMTSWWVWDTAAG